MLFNDKYQNTHARINWTEESTVKNKEVNHW